MLLILADMASFRTFKGEKSRLCKICGAAPLPQIKTVQSQKNQKTGKKIEIVHPAFLEFLLPLTTLAFGCIILDATFELLLSLPFARSSAGYSWTADDWTACECTWEGFRFSWGGSYSRFCKSLIILESEPTKRACTQLYSFVLVWETQVHLQ